MPALQNAFKTYEAVGNREDLTDIISNISPDDTPFLSSIGTSKASATYHEWQTDTLSEAKANAQVESDEATIEQSQPTTRVGNRTQIFSKTFAVSGTQDVVNKAGRGRELAYQAVKKGKELKLDIELALIGNQTSAAGDAGTARKLRGYGCWMETNFSGGAASAHGTAAAAVTAGTARALTVDMLSDMMQKIYESGGNPDTLMVAPAGKRKLTALLGKSNDAQTTYRKESDAKAGANVEVWMSDFGLLKIKTNRVMKNSDNAVSVEKNVMIYDTSMFSVAYLRPIFSNPLANTGDSTKRQMIGELTLRVNNEASSGLITDIDWTL